MMKGTDNGCCLLYPSKLASSRPSIGLASLFHPLAHTAGVQHPSSLLEKMKENPSFKKRFHACPGLEETETAATKNFFFCALALAIEFPNLSVWREEE